VRRRKRRKEDEKQIFFAGNLAFTVLAVPIFFPLVLKLGFDPVWFGVIVCVTNMIGLIIPPMAMNVFVVSGITKVPIGTIYKGCYPYIVISWGWVFV
jgi:C4-dicarboxylate transporter DctM subunit